LKKKKEMDVMRKISIITVFLFLSFIVNAADNDNFDNFRFEHLTISDGLSQSAVNEITQDCFGFVWIGTQDGLNRFDGYEVKVYKNDPQDKNSLTNNQILAITSDTSGNLWIGTFGGGLNIYNPHCDSFLNIINRPEFFKNISGNEIMRVFRDSKGNMWVGTEIGLYRARAAANSKSVTEIRFERVQLTINKQLANYQVRSICESTDGKILIGTLGGLYYVDMTGNTLSTLYPFSELAFPTVIALHQQKNGILWIGTLENGLYKLQNIQGKVQVTHQNNISFIRVTAITEDKKGNIWVASRQGLAKIAKDGAITYYKADNTSENAISDERLNCLFIGNTNILWIGSEYKGLNWLNLSRKKFHTIKNIGSTQNALSTSFVTAIHSSQPNSVFVATDGGGIDKLSFDPLSGMFLNIEHWNRNLSGKDKQVISLYQDKNGSVWFGSAQNSINIINSITQQLKTLSIFGYVFTIVEDSYGYIWLGTWGQGLYRYNKAKATLEHYKLNLSDEFSTEGDIIFNLFEDSEKKLWIGTKGNGLHRLLNPSAAPDKARYKHYYHDKNKKKSLAHNDVYVVTEDKEKNIWIGTVAGLNKLSLKALNDNVEPEFTIWNEKNGLPNSVVYGILVDNDNNIWLSTNKGISKYLVKKHYLVNFDVNDGLQSNEFRQNAYFKDNKGRMYFGGIAGLTYFNPSEIDLDTSKTNVVFTSLKINGVDVPINQSFNSRVLLNSSILATKTIELKASEREFSIGFTAVNFTIPEKIQFQYRLLGFNEQWQPISNRIRNVTYTNLSPGDYELQVKATNSDGVWSEKYTSMKIVVLPPLWRTWPAFLLYFMVLVVLYILFKKYSLIAVKKKNQLLIDSLEKDKIEELTKLKLQFYTNISHELRTPLTLISSPIEDLIHDESVDNKVKAQLSVVYKNVQRLLHMVNQLLDFRKIDAGQVKLTLSYENLVLLLNDVYTVFDQYALSRNINLQYIHKPSEVMAWIDREKILTVMFNLLSNAFKYSPDNSLITLELCYEQPTENEQEDGGQTLPNILIKVIDNGCGISSEHLDKIFDRFYRVHNEKGQFIPGSGVGLSIAREFMLMHGGNIQVESEPGKGSCFTITIKQGYRHLLHIESPEYFEDKSGAQKEPANDSSQQYLERMANSLNEKVQASLQVENVLLLAEDNLELLDYISSKLSQKFKIVTAPNGEDAFKTALSINPDLIITDLMMPVMDGLTLCKKLKSDIHTSHIPVIVITARSASDANIEALESGAEVFIQKPFSVDVLKAQINSILDSRKRIQNSINKQLILQPKDIAVTSLDERFLKKLMEVVEQNLANPDYGIKELTHDMAMSHSVLFRKIKSLTGMNIVEFIRSVRLKKAALILEKNKIPITELCSMIGFNDPKYFSKCFIAQFGLTPTEYAAAKGEGK